MPIQLSGSLVITGSITTTGGITISGSILSASYSDTASFSNNFRVLGDLTASTAVITGTLTAQTLVVQTVTSSIVYSSGSNIFGSTTSNLQTFTGSIQASGSSSHFLLGGNVGIGTSSPSAPLEIYASSNSKLVLNATLNTSSYQNQIDFKNAGTSSAFIQSGKNPDNTAIGLAFGTTTEVMRITGSTLYVGITGSVYYSSPSLVVGSTLATSVPLQVVSDASGRNIRLYNAEYNGSTSGSTLRLGFVAGSGNASSAIQAYALGESTTGNLVLNPSGGNVGIAKSFPSYSLDVVGAVKASTYFTSDYYRDSRLESMLSFSSPNEIRVGSGTAADFVTIFSNATETMRVTGSCVGIGYSNPGAFVASSGYGNLVVGNGSGAQGVTIFGGTAGSSGLMFADATSGTGAYTGYVLYNHSTDAMELAAGGGTPRVTITSSGLKFQNGASSLNYYEEGVYTPTLTMSTSGTVTASTWYKLYYTRIGRLVHVFGEIRLTSASSPVGALNISLPYTSAPDGNSGGGAANLLARGASSPVESYSIGTINSSIYMYLSANQTTMQLYYLINGSNGIVDGSMISGNEEIGINMTYLTS
jgi:hypothetical protein